MSTATITIESLSKEIEDLRHQIKSINTRTYILFYHYRYQRPLEKIFEHIGPLKEAIEIGRDHCEKMDYRFIKVRPFIVDLKDQEKRKSDDVYYSEDT